MITLLHFLVYFGMFSCIISRSSGPVWNVRNRRSGNELWQTNNLNGFIEKGYYVEMLIGTPPQALNILLDTGSSNFAVASKSNPLISKYFEAKNSTSIRDMNLQDIDIEYTEGFWKGHLVTDLVSVPTAGMEKSARVSMAEITESEKFFIAESGWQGILGLGYDELIRPSHSNTKAFMRSVVDEIGIDDIFSLQLCMADVRKFSDSVSGTFILGDYDRSVGTIYWTRIVREWYYDVLVIGMKVGNTTVSVSCTEFNNDKAIVDSGTTNLHLPQKIFSMVTEIMKKHLATLLPDLVVHDSFWTGGSLLCWDDSVDPYSLFPVITIYLPSIEINHTITLSVHPEHYVLFYGNDTDMEKACYKYGISLSSSGTVLGAVVMEEYNVVFDRANRRVGFALSNCSSTSKLVYDSGYINSTSCVYESNKSPSTMQIAMYVILGLLILCMAPVCVLSYTWCRKKKKYSSLVENPMTAD
uniref:beta-secretase 1-like n=1 Tax=Styela clava TaxID=7725 RepID=UPI001939A6F9|nr:beta-secretase 1-like [Styela clava]